MRFPTTSTAVLAFMLASPSGWLQPFPTEATVPVSFVFPDGATKSTELTDREVQDLLHENFGYMIEWWVRGALTKLKLPYVITVVDQTTKAKAVTSIAGVANGTAGQWVLYVDGFRS